MYYLYCLVLERRLNQNHEPEVFMKNVFLTFTIILLMTIMGCESNMLEPLADDSSKEANLEEAKMALDDGKYDSAISALSSYKGSSDPEVAGILSSAYMGKAGLDLTYMLENIDSSDGENFDIIASAFHFTTSDKLFASSSVLHKAASDTVIRTILTDDVLEYLKNLHQAQIYLAASIKAHPDNDDLTVQMGLVSSLHFIFDIGYIVAKVKGSNIPINRAAYETLFPKTTTAAAWTKLGNDVDAYLTNNEADLQEFAGDIHGLQTDLLNVYETALVFIDNLGSDEDITRDFNEFITEILGLDRGSSDTEIRNKIGSYGGSDLAYFINKKLLDN